MLDKSLRGDLILSARLTYLSGVNDITKSWQDMGDAGTENYERAYYVDFNAKEFFRYLSRLDNVSEIKVYGYWKKPAKNAHTLYDFVCFVTIAIHKECGVTNTPRLITDIPVDVLI